ncbi:hypothetical protein [uncultured Lacinutrix sp.]|uniref:hypothetical protein n=1 Tax=uncultured Lacinutrix sp. TaxID=574032 RepID=UPI00260BF65D|nr:hypothetical protein [uncultured Lacinutrix sp.]
MKNKTTFLSISLLFLLFLSCLDDDIFDDNSESQRTFTELPCQDTSDIICNTDSNSPFKDLYEELLNSNSAIIEESTFDVPVHAYSFEVSELKQICSIGYQSFHSDPNIQYEIKIYNHITNTIVYSGSHLFSQNAISYSPLSDYICLQPNTPYSILRIQNNVTYIEQTIGMMLNSPSYDFLPYENEHIKILGSGVLDDSESIYTSLNILPMKTMLPKIDIIFAE